MRCCKNYKSYEKSHKGSGHGINPDKIVDIYRRRAGNYDITSQLYYLIGYRGEAYRKSAVEALGAQTGDTVVDICCGTGLNFPLLQKAIGDEGKLIGVDLTDAMLEQARRRVEKNHWENVELVQSDVSEFDFPTPVNGVITTFALSLVPNYDKVIENAYNALAPGGRFVDMASKTPRGMLRFLKPLVFPFLRPFGDPEKYMDVRTWESIKKHFGEAEFEEFFGGAAYVTRGEK